METTNIFSKDVLTSIADSYSLLTKSEKKVSDYILQKKGDPQYMSITALAEECGVTEATIFRYCKRLGFGGYSDFKLALAKSQGGSRGLHEQLQSMKISRMGMISLLPEKSCFLFTVRR